MAELLLIEDDPVTCEVLSLLLAEDGWQVLPAESGEIALTLLQKVPRLPALVLCDQRLPGLSGTALAEEIRTAYSRAGAAAPVLLAMSATRSAELAGYDGMLLKPFSAKEVRSALERLQNEDSQKLQVLAPESLTAVPVLDQQIFQQLCNSMGLDRAKDLYAFAMKDASERVQRILASAAAWDVAALGRDAHMLKGAAGMIGARRLASLAQELEMPSVAHSETSAQLQSKLAMLTAALDDIELMLETLFPARL